jgi:Flp pilus assembly protein TadD
MGVDGMNSLKQDKGGRQWAYTILLSIFAVASASGQVNTIPDSQSQTQLGGQNQIVGTVFGPSGRPAENPVQVRLSTMTRGNRTAVTNGTGNFAFRGLPTGSYTITIDKEKEFEPFSQTVDLRQFRGGPPQLFTMTIRLVMKARPDVKPAVLNAEFANVPAKAQEYYFEAVELSRKGDFEGAIVQLQLAINVHPTFMNAYNELGVQYLRTYKLQDADDAFQQALKLEPDSYSPMVNRGIANVMMKRYGEAVPILRKAVVKNVESAVGHYFLGQALANLGLFADAEKELLKAVELGEGKMQEAHRILAVIYTQRGETRKAVENLETYLQLKPTAPDAERLRQKLQQLRESS